MRNYRYIVLVGTMLVQLTMAPVKNLMASETDSLKRVSGGNYIGLAVPFQGIGKYKEADRKIVVWNLTPLSYEREVGKRTGLRFYVYTVYSHPEPRRIGEFEVNLEANIYPQKRNRPEGLFGFYFGPVLMMQLNDQDTKANLGGAGISVGYKGKLSELVWFRSGLYAAGHRYIWGPKEELQDMLNGKLNAGLFTGLTLFEVGIQI